jgi:hypothetical protein
MRYKWKLSKQAEHDIPLDESMMRWAVHQAEIGGIGTFDPAAIAAYWRERVSVPEALAPPPIESEKLEPLLSTDERPLVRLPETQLAEKVQQHLEKEV